MDVGQLMFWGSTICLLLTLHLSVQLLSQHLLYWKKPKEQNAILIIILMAPLYAIDSYVGLLDYQGSDTFFTFLDSVKECYEALVRYSFPRQVLSAAWPSVCTLNPYYLTVRLSYETSRSRLCLLLPGDCKVLGSLIQLLEHIHQQEQSPR